MSDSLHVALFTDFHPATLGGVQTAMRSLCDSLRERGHRVSVFCPPAPDSTDAGPDIVVLSPTPLKMSNGLPLVLPTRANRRLVDAAFDERGPIHLVHALTTYGGGISGLRAARRHGIPVVQSMQSRDDTMIEKYSPAPFPAALTMRLLHGWFVPLRHHPRYAGDGRTARLAWRPLIAQAQAADHVVVPTQHFAQRLTDRGVSRPIHVVSNGIDDALLDSLRATADPGPTPDGPLRALWCGRLSPEKRPLEAIEVLHRAPGCTLDIYGSGPLIDRVRTAASDPALDGRVRYHGEVDQSACLSAMRDHDVLLLTSDADTQGMVLLEAVAMGLPVVYCDPELSETVPADGGLRTGNHSVAAFTTALNTLSDNRSQLTPMRAALSAHADEPRQSRHLSALLTVYTTALAHTSPSTVHPTH